MKLKKAAAATVSALLVSSVSVPAYVIAADSSSNGDVKVILAPTDSLDATVDLDHELKLDLVIDKKKGTVSLPSGDVSVQLLPNGKLKLHLKAKDRESAAGVWHLSLGGKDISVRGTGDFTYTLDDVAAGKTQLNATFIADPQPVQVKLDGASVTGDLPLLDGLATAKLQLLPNGKMLVHLWLKDKDKWMGQWKLHWNGIDYPLNGDGDMTFTIDDFPETKGMMKVHFRSDDGNTDLNLNPIEVTMPEGWVTSAMPHGDIKILHSAPNTVVKLLPNGRLHIHLMLNDGAELKGKWQIQVGDTVYNEDTTDGRAAVTIPNVSVDQLPRLTAQFIPDATGVATVKVGPIDLQLPGGNNGGGQPPTNGGGQPPTQQPPQGEGKVLVDLPNLRIVLWPDNRITFQPNVGGNSEDEGTWTINIGGKTYTIPGTLGGTVTLNDVPVGTYPIEATFTPTDTGAAPVTFNPVTVGVPTVTGGQLPNTANPWYNWLLLGFAMTAAGAASVWKGWRRNAE